MSGVLPATIGLCSDPVCAEHFYMPDAKTGDRCPMEHDEPKLLVIYEPCVVIHSATDDERGAVQQ